MQSEASIKIKKFIRQSEEELTIKMSYSSKIKQSFIWKISMINK
jgi:hypothetical protein